MLGMPNDANNDGLAPGSILCVSYSTQQENGEWHYFTSLLLSATKKIEIFYSHSTNIDQFRHLKEYNDTFIFPFSK
jgi:hypothetical protein